MPDRSSQPTYQATPAQRAALRTHQHAIATQLADHRPDDPATEPSIVDIARTITDEGSYAHGLLLQSLPIAYGVTRAQYAAELCEIAVASA